MTDLRRAQPAQLAKIAGYLFQLGLDDAEAGRRPQTREELTPVLRQSFGATDWSIGQLRKFRQVYGAGYDMRAGLRRAGF